MSKNLRVLALVLAVLMVAALFVGCSNTENPADTTAATTTAATTTAATTTEATSTEATTTEATTTEGTTTEATTTADPSKIDLGGYEFVLNALQYTGTGTLVVDASTEAGAALQDIYWGIEDELNCFINITQYDNGTEALMTAAVSGDKYADFVCCRQSTWIPLAMMGGVRPLESMVDAGLDLYNDDVFNQFYTMMSEVKGQHYALDFTGYYADTVLGHFYAFNKELCEGAGYPADDLYQAVRDGKWDYDMFLDVARKVTKDLDGDGTNDIWGVALDCDGNETTTNGSRVVLYDEANDRYYCDLSNPQLMKSLQFMYELSQGDCEEPVIGDTVSRGTRRDMFYAGQCGFAGLYGGNLDAEGFIEMAGNNNVGALPMPKGPDVDHYNMNMVDLDTFVCLVSNQDWENSAKVMTALGHELCDFEAYKAKCLDEFGGDEQAIEMLFDYALAYGTMNIEKCSDNMYQITRKGFYKSIYELTHTPAQAAETYQELVQAELDNVFKQK